MKTLDKIIATIVRNLGISIVLLIAIALFGIFSDGIIGGLITAASALIAYICIELLYRDYKKSSAPRTKKK